MHNRDAAGIGDLELQQVWQKKNAEGYQHKIASADYLKENSKELVEFCAQQELVPESGVCSLHELGCGAGRNLHYLAERFPLLQLSANDLCKEACFEYMPKSLQQRLEFEELDTCSFLTNQVKAGAQVEILLSADHLMHLSRQIIGEVYSLMAQYAGQMIVLREPVGERVALVQGEDGSEFVWAADQFSDQFPGFRLAAHRHSQRTTARNKFDLMLFKRNS